MKKFIFSLLTLALVFSFTLFFITDKKEVSAYQSDIPVPASIVTSNFDLSTYGIPYPTIDFDDDYYWIDITFNTYTPNLSTNIELVSFDFYAYGVKAGLPYNEVTVDYTLDELDSYLEDNFRYVFTFRKTDVYYTVTFDLAGGVRTGGGELTQSVKFGNSAIAPTVYRTGYTFIGWDKSLDNITANTTITARWTIQKRIVTFNLLGGTPVGGGALTQTIDYGGSATAPIVTKTGYTFIGWDKPLTNITQNTTITAQWDINYYTVTFNIDGGTYVGSVPLTQNVVYGGSATIPDYHDITKENYFFWGWINLDKVTNVSSNVLVSVIWEQPVFDLLILFENSYFEDLSSNKYTPVTITQLVNTFKYNQGFFLNESSVLVFGDFVLDVGKRFVQWDIRFGTSPDISDTIDSIISTNIDIFDYSTWQDFLNIDYYSSSNFNSNNNYYYLTFYMVTEDSTFTVNLNDYITGIKYNEDGTLKEYTYSSSTYTVIEGQSLSMNNTPIRPLDFKGKFFAYWQDSSGNAIDIYHIGIYQDYTLTAVYVDKLYNVTFWNGFTKLGVKGYRSGFGTIQPPNYSFLSGTQLLGWSDELNGAVVDLNAFALTKDIDLYAVTNFNSLIPDSNFEIPYQECGTFDIPCGLGNAVIYFLNEFPLISDVVYLVVPIGTLFSMFTEYFVVFETLGILYTLSLGILFVYFIFRLFK